MSDPHVPDTPQTNKPGGPAALAGGNGEVDPLEQLHKMSRTAGLGATDYVAVNAVSVAALVLGLGSALTLLNVILLVIPLAAIVCAVVALYQIRHSNGTQTGRALAWLGLVLAFGFMGAQVARQFIHGSRTRADREAINQLVTQFGQKLNQEDVQSAYAMMGPRFRERVSFDDFSNALRLRFRHPSYGKINSMQANIIQFDTDEAGLNRTAATNMVIKLARGGEDDRTAATFIKVGDEWFIEDLPWWFPQAGRG